VAYDRDNYTVRWRISNHDACMLSIFRCLTPDERASLMGDLSTRLAELGAGDVLCQGCLSPLDIDTPIDESPYTTDELAMLALYQRLPLVVQEELMLDLDDRYSRRVGAARRASADKVSPEAWMHFVQAFCAATQEAAQACNARTTQEAAERGWQWPEYDTIWSEIGRERDCA